MERGRWPRAFRYRASWPYSHTTPLLGRPKRSALMNPSVDLPLQELSDRHPGLTKAIGDSYTEAAAVCLSRHHVSPAMLDMQGMEVRAICSVGWSEPDSRTLRAWANETDATEAGAYGVSLAAVEVGQGLVAIARAETRTGADYYVAPHGHSPDDLEHCFRLEVSGTDAGDEGVIRSRLHSKVAQARRGVSNLPALAAVVGFKAKSIAIAAVAPES